MYKATPTHAQWVKLLHSKVKNLTPFEVDRRLIEQYDNNDLEDFVARLKTTHRRKDMDVSDWLAQLKRTNTYIGRWDPSSQLSNAEFNKIVKKCVNCERFTVQYYLMVGTLGKKRELLITYDELREMARKADLIRRDIRNNYTPNNPDPDSDITATVRSMRLTDHTSGGSSHPSHTTSEDSVEEVESEYENQVDDYSIDAAMCHAANLRSFRAADIANFRRVEQNGISQVKPIDSLPKKTIGRI